MALSKRMNAYYCRNYYHLYPNTTTTIITTTSNLTAQTSTTQHHSLAPCSPHTPAQLDLALQYSLIDHIPVTSA
ncbi:hypothetical protein E2C01_082263 [Portunus trituberculatus]|uniref:Uncharacterized protein n=1 Tax=Portunus trituberculatus TaxID=210409 RepID=A0A5B7IU27_PORTR|nr:hypothetical protein [Portunus trituberculatus]